MKTADYVLIEEHRFWPKYSNDAMVIPVGTFIRPIEHQYVPLHIKDNFTYMNKETEIFVYCSYGMFPVPRKLIREK